MDCRPAARKTGDKRCGKQPANGGQPLRDWSWRRSSNQIKRAHNDPHSGEKTQELLDPRAMTNRADNLPSSAFQVCENLTPKRGAWFPLGKQSRRSTISYQRLSTIS